MLGGSLSYKSKRISCSFFCDLVDLEIELFQKGVAFETLLFVLQWALEVLLFRQLLNLYCEFLGFDLLGEKLGVIFPYGDDNYSDSIIIKFFFEYLIEILNWAAKIDDVASDYDIVKIGVCPMFPPVERENWAICFINLHIFLDIVDDLTVVISHLNFPAFGPLLGSYPCNPDPSSQLQHSLILEQTAMIDNISREYDACFPQFEPIETMGEGDETGYIQIHLIVFMDYYVLSLYFEDDLVGRLLIVAHQKKFINSQICLQTKSRYFHTVYYQSS